MSTTEEPLIDAGEWEAQERGLRAARRRDTNGMDAAAMNCRLVAEAVMSMPRSAPPHDFAVDVVRRVARHEAGFERLLSRILLAAFLLALIIVGVQYGEPWWQALRQTLGSESLGWVLAGMGCLAVSWLCSRALELAGRAVNARPVR